MVVFLVGVVLLFLKVLPYPSDCYVVMDGLFGFLLSKLSLSYL